MVAPLLLSQTVTHACEPGPCANVMRSRCGFFDVGYVVSAFAESWRVSQDVPAHQRGRPSGLAHHRDPPSQELLRLGDRSRQRGRNPGRTRNSNPTSSSHPPTRCSPTRRWETSLLIPETGLPPAPSAPVPRGTPLHSPESSPD